MGGVTDPNVALNYRSICLQKIRELKPILDKYREVKNSINDSVLSNIDTCIDGEEELNSSFENGAYEDDVTDFSGEIESCSSGFSTTSSKLKSLIDQIDVAINEISEDCQFLNQAAIKWYNLALKLKQLQGENKNEV